MNIQLDVYHKYQTKRGAEIVDDNMMVRGIRE
jgi:hypothetical protein